MYQSLALAPSPGQAAYADSGAFLHAPGAGSPVFVPPARVPSMLPYLPACEPGPQPPALAAHPNWAQAAAADSSAFGSGSPHPPAAQPPGATTFPFTHSPPGPGGGGGVGSRDSSAYQGAVLAREQYPAPLGRPVGAAYPTAYPAYVSTEVAPSWTSGPFDSSVLHGLPGRPAGLAGRRATFGECRAGRCLHGLGSWVLAVPRCEPALYEMLPLSPKRQSFPGQIGHQREAGPEAWGLVHLGGIRRLPQPQPPRVKNTGA